MMPVHLAARSALIALACIGLLSACSPDDGGGPTDAAARKAVGATLFDENCSACHGQMGRGPSLDSIRSLSRDDRRAAIRNHPTAGQIPQRLPAADLQRLIEFLEQE